MQNNCYQLAIHWVRRICLWPLTIAGVFAQGPLDSLATELQSRLNQHPTFRTFALPPVAWAPDLPVNARFVRDTIFLGTVQPDFHTRGDSLSLIFHEYLHGFFKEKGRFIYSGGDSIPQWDTDEWVIYRPSQMQVRATLNQLHLLPEAEKNMRKKLAAPSRLPFHYAPSRLAKEELHAYRLQLRCLGKIGYQLSPEAVLSIKIRRKQLRTTLRERRRYEHKAGYFPDGMPKNPS